MKGVPKNKPSKGHAGKALQIMVALAIVLLVVAVYPKPRNILVVLVDASASNIQMTAEGELSPSAVDYLNNVAEHVYEYRSKRKLMKAEQQRTYIVASTGSEAAGSTLPRDAGKIAQHLKHSVKSFWTRIEEKRGTNLKLALELVNRDLAEYHAKNPPHALASILGMGTPTVTLVVYSDCVIQDSNGRVLNWSQCEGALKGLTKYSRAVMHVVGPAGNVVSQVRSSCETAGVRFSSEARLPDTVRS